MKWNTSDSLFGLIAGVLPPLDWWLALLVGTLFGLFMAMSLVEPIFAPSSDARDWIGSSALVVCVIVTSVVGWRLGRKTRPTPTR
jgi:hypothetical protein